MPEFAFHPTDALDPDQIKRALPLAYAAHELGIAVENGLAVCPFHDDSSPSFRLYVNDSTGEEKWSCDPCGLRARDVFDLIMKADGVNFPTALAKARRMVAELPPGTDAKAYNLPRANRPFSQAEVDAARLEAQAPQATQAEREGLWWRIAQETGIERNPDLAVRAGQHLVGQWGWGYNPASGEVWMPHWAPPSATEANPVMTGCKIRQFNGTRRSVEGSKYDNLYGAWLPRQHQYMLLTEGETDCAWASWAAAKGHVPIDVRSLPSGATSMRNGDGPGRLIEQIRGAAIVYLAFDPDGPGIDASEFWYEVLVSQGGYGGEGRLMVCHLPLGLDLRDAQPNLVTLLSHAGPRRVPSSRLLAIDGFWAMSAREGVTRRVASWTARPTARLTPGPDEDVMGAGHEVELTVAGVTSMATMLNEDMRTKAGLSKWARDSRLVWHGSDVDANEVAERIYEQASFVPEKYITSRAGMHRPPKQYEYAGPSLVLPHATPVGKLPWVYKSFNKVIEDRCDFPTGGASQGMIETFLSLGPLSLTTPILAWMAASVRRFEVENFPLLFISGASGSGKSTIAHIAAAMMGSSIEGNLAQLTPFTLMALLSSTTTIPVFLDEYTRQSGAAIDEFRADVPLVYQGGSAMRGLASQEVKQYKLTSPVIVAGENLFTNTREIERSIVVEATRNGQNFDALRALEDNGTYRQFALAYNSWVAANIENMEPMPTQTNDRDAYNRAVIQAGWTDLHGFCVDVLDWPGLPNDVDFTTATEARATREDPYDEALRVVADSPRPGQVPEVVVVAEGTLVQFSKAVKRYEQLTGEILPGSSQAIQRYLLGKGYEMKDGVRHGNGATRSTYKLVKGYYANPYEASEVEWSPDPEVSA